MSESEIKEAVDAERDRCARLAKVFAEQGEDLEAAIRRGDWVNEQGNVVRGPGGMPYPPGALAAVPKGWYPQTWGAHLARIEFMKEMGQDHFSRTDARWHVRRFRTTVANEECERWAGEMRKLGYACHPGLSVEENLTDFARWVRKNKLKGE